MNSETAGTGRHWAAVVALASLVPLYAAWHAAPYLNDDAYITLTYAKNLAEGRGFVYNVPPPTLGTTSPLFTLVNALAGWLLGAERLPWIAAGISGLCWIAAGWLIFLGRGALGLAPGLAALVAAFLMTARYPYLGGEATLFLVLFVAALVLALSRRWYAAGFAVGLLFLTRGEGVLLLPFLVATRWLLPATEAQRADPAEDPPAPRYFRRLFSPDFLRDCVLMGIFALIPVVLWAVYAWFQFGHVLPHTLEAKMTQGRLAGAELFPQGLWHAMTREWASELAPWGIPVRYLLWVLAGIGLVSCFVLPERRRLLPWVLWTFAYVAAYSLLQVPAYAWWYRIPAYWLWTLLIPLGLWWLYRLADAHLAGRTGKYLRRAVVAVAVVLLALRGLLEIFIASYAGDPRGPLYMEVSAYIMKNTPVDAAIATVEVGYIGFYTDREIVDLAGLVTPSVLPLINEGRAFAVFTERKPELYLMLPWTGDPLNTDTLRVLGSGNYWLQRRFRHEKAPGDALLYGRIERLQSSSEPSSPSSPSSDSSSGMSSP